MYETHFLINHNVRPSSCSKNAKALFSRRESGSETLESTNLPTVTASKSGCLAWSKSGRLSSTKGVLVCADKGEAKAGVKKAENGCEGLRAKQEETTQET